jgi:hypothetical protein
MALVIQIDGMEEALDRLEVIERKAKVADLYDVFAPWMNDLVEFTRMISPVITGSYQASHRWEFTGRFTATQTIDPTARNTMSGVLVTSYAGNVEGNHEVYRQAFQHISRMAPEIADSIIEELTQ